MKILAVPLCFLLAGCNGKMLSFPDLGLSSTPKPKPVAGYVVDRPKPTLTSFSSTPTLPVKDVAVYQPSSVPPAPMPLAFAPPVPAAVMPTPSAPSVPPVAMPNPATTAIPLSSEPPAAEPSAAAPLPLAASLGQGQGEGLKAEPLPAPTAPVPQVMSLASAVQHLANSYNITALIEIHGAPDVTLTGEPPRLETALASLLDAVTPRHYGAIARSQSGAPVALIVSPHPIVGAGQ
jgi:hypothetical protein